MTDVILRTFGQRVPMTTSSTGGMSGNSFSLTLDSTGKQTLDVTTLGLSTTTGKQISGLTGKYNSGLFFTNELYWETVNSTTFRVYSTSESLHSGLIVTGIITDAA